jgi:predicted oxidoreductase
MCVENKITTFDHADIYGDYTADFGKAFSSSKIEKITIISNVGSKWLPKTVKTVLNYEYSKVHHLVC